MTPNQKIRAGNKFRQFIDQHFVTYADFAKYVKVRPCTVSHWMAGRNRIPTLILDRLSRNFPELDKKLFRPDVKEVDRRRRTA